MTKAKAKPKTQWEQRFVGEAMVPAVDLVANPQNFRKHPKAQRKAMTAALVVPLVTCKCENSMDSPDTTSARMARF